jgi:hypothetical protein
MFHDNRWSVPLYQERLGNIVECRGDAVLLHDFGPIRRCDATTCQSAELIDADFGDLEVVSPRRTVLGNQLLAVAESNTRGGIRYVQGDQTPGVLLDDLVRNREVQVNSTVSGTRIFSRPGFAVVTLFTDSGVFAFYFADGQAPVPAQIRWQ